MVWAPWPDHIIDSLKKLAADGYSASQAAAQFPGMSRNSAVGLAHRNRIRFLGTSSGPTMVVQRRSPRWAPQKPKPPYVAVEAVPDDRTGMLTLMELQRDSCRGPIGNPSTPDFRYCGKKQVEGYPYCSKCCRLYYQPR